MRRAISAAAIAALVALAPAADADADRLVVRAARAHLGDGRVLAPAALLVEDGRIAWIGSPASLPPHAGAGELRCDELMPGLVAWRRPSSVGDAASVDPGRLAADAWRSPERSGEGSGDPLLDAGVTAVAISPGVDRLVGGRAAFARLRDDGSAEWAPREGALHASLSAEALQPPEFFEPVLRVNADNPLPPARPQRPGTPMAASAELRRLLFEGAGSAGAFADAAAGRIPLIVHARAEDEIRRALDLTSGSSANLVITGADEAWKLAEELAAAKALVVLEPVDAPDALRRGLDARADAPALLHRAGARVALADAAEEPDPLLLAALAVREGLPREQAIAAITGLPARAAGASRVLANGAPADLVGFDGDPLAASARPSFVLRSGHLADAPAPSATDADLAGDEKAPPLALRVGRALDAEKETSPATLLVRDARIASISPGRAAPQGARVLDFGDGSVAVPGFLDAFSRAGLEPGPSPSGSPRVKAPEAMDPRHPSLQRALRAGITSGLGVPATRGSVMGMAAVASMLPRPVLQPRDADDPRPRRAAEGRPEIEVIQADAGLVTWLDDGPSDDAARQPRLRALRETLQKAKAYHEGWLKAEKKPEENRGKERRGKEKLKGKQEKPEPPEKDPALEPWRAVLAGKARAYLRSGREDLMIAGIDAFKGVGVTPVLCGAEDADLVASEIASRGVSVVLPPELLRRDEDGSRPVAALLRQAGIPVAFGSFDPGASAELPARIAALVRRGLAPADALAGLTRTAAIVAGLGDGAGLLSPASRADIVVFDGDPMEPSSRVLAVVARGRLVFEAPDAGLVAGARP